MTTPVIWKKVFEILDSDYLGINYDPSHFVWQMMDYIRPIYEFKDKIFHVHYKDIKIFKDKLAACGIMAYPLDYMARSFRDLEMSDGISMYLRLQISDMMGTHA